MWYLYLFLGLVGLYFIFRSQKRPVPPGTRPVPEVAWSLPLVGHGPAFSKDIIGFIRRCRQQYGDVFKIKVFRRNMIVVCDRALISEYFKERESSMSMYDVLTQLYFADAFSDDPNDLPKIITIVKKTIAVRSDEFVPKIEAEANRLIDRLKKRSQEGSIRLTDEMIRFVASTSALCFLGIELPDKIFDVLMDFTHLLNQLVVATYFFPKSWIRFFMNPRLSHYRKQITSYLQPIIQEYRDHPEKSESLVFRGAVDYLDENGVSLTDQQVGDIVVCLLYVSSENTALGLSNTIIDLARSPEIWEQVRNEAEAILPDAKTLFASPLLNACVMESARMNSHIFALNRRPVAKQTLGNYYVGDADTVALCEPMLMSHECSTDLFSDPLKYNPKRFLDPQNEPSDAKSVMTWGAGVHLCPGKLFALYEIKMATALITSNFDIHISGPLPPLDYFSPSAFAERQTVAQLIPRQVSVVKKSGLEIDGLKVEVFPEGGWLIRNYILPDEQRRLYNYTIDLSEGSSEHKEIINQPTEKAYPITYHRLVYTGTSNCPEPIVWYKWAKELSTRVRGLDPSFAKEPFNSLYAQLYGLNGKMAVHKDEHVTWGISVSIGASCDFLFGTSTITLHSGDVFIADFSKTQHAVLKIHDNTAPGWFTDEAKTFGRARCSIQIRSVPTTDGLMTTDQFKAML